MNFRWPQEICRAGRRSPIKFGSSSSSVSVVPRQCDALLEDRPTAAFESVGGGGGADVGINDTGDRRIYFVPEAADGDRD